MPDWSKAAWVDPSLHWQPLPVPDLPPRLLLDLATKCNLRCPMCPVWGSPENDKIDSVVGVMDIEASRRLLDEVQAARPLVQPNLYAEPLLAPKLREQISSMKRRGMAVAMNTNGLSLSEDLAKFFVDVQVDSIMFSIDAVTRETLKLIRGLEKIEKIESAVFRLMRARGAADYPRVGVSFTIQDGNRHEVESFVARWVGVVDVVRTGLVFINGRFPDMTEPEPRVPCPTLYQTLPVHNDGQVTVCCLDGFKATNMGNVFHDGVRVVWHGEEFAKVRYYHETGQYDKVPFCKNCNGWAQHEFTEEVRDGLLIRHSPQFVYYNKIDRLRTWTGNRLGGHPAPPRELAEA
ncbi:MAG TPA: radical SAM protein [bacterium]|nr:radical SAM protein [bacterium]